MKQLPVSECLEFRIAASVMVSEQPSSLPDGYDSIMLNISMRNISKEPVRLIGRKWIINSAEDQSDVVEGDTVFNTHPLLCPGQIFSISGFHIVRQPASLSLTLLGKDNHGENFITLPLVIRIDKSS